MEFKKYLKLKKLISKVTTFEEFLEEVSKWPRHYAVITPKNWTKKDYLDFYGHIKGGHTYVNIFPAAV